MVETKNDDIVVDDVKGMAELAGISDAGHMFQVSPVLAQKSQELRSGLISEAKYHALIYFSVGGISRDPLENWKAAGCLSFAKT